MINQINHFYFDQQFSVRTVLIHGVPWFVATDVCKVLKISNVTDALYKLDMDEKSTLGLTESQAGYGAQSLNIINESGLYTLILRCRDAVKPGTVPHRFRKWITNDVLPSIRKTGSYHTAKAPAMAEENGSPQKPLDRRRGSYKNRKSELPSGVYHHQSKYNPYRATARINGKFVHVGSFPTVEDAVAAIERFYETGTVQRLHELKTKPHINISNLVPKITNSTLNQTDLMSHLKVFLETAQLLSGYQNGKDLAWDLIAFTQEEASRHC